VARRLHAGPEERFLSGDSNSGVTLRSNRPPLVIKKKKTSIIRLGEKTTGAATSSVVGKRDNIELDMTKQGVAMSCGCCSLLRCRKPTSK
jgi:hypothetical protein